MERQRLNNPKEIFLQRRYAIRLGRRYALAAASAMLIGLMGCSNVNNINSVVAQPSTVQQAPKMQPTAVEPKLVTANTKFGFKLFSEVIKEDSGKNVFVSPSSVAIALAMTYNGAAGETQKAIAKTLELQSMNLQQINSANAALKALLENPDPKVQLAIANSLWAKQGFPINPEFLRRNQQFYQAKVTNLDFSDRNAPNIINDWVKQNTQGKIEKIVEQISPDQMLFLINAIYFKGKWTEQFDKTQTAEQPFYLTSGKQKQHPMMSQSGKYRYYETNKFQAVSLPYGDNGRMSLYVFLPTKNSNLSAFYKDLKTENWEKWMTQFTSREGFIRLPRFKMDYEIELNKALRTLGMDVAFGSKADFSGIAQNLAISKVKHKTFVEVNEEGTEAAAVTSVEMRVTSAMPSDPPFRMIVDRPFFCAIRDNQTGTVLFMGSIVEPQ